MRYYDQNEERSRRWGIISGVLYVVVCAALMFIHYRISLPQPEAGILVDFGDGSRGRGVSDTRPDESSRQTTPPAPATSERVMTTDDDDAPPIVAESVPATTPQTPEPATRQQTTPVAEPEPRREINRRTLFPGRTEGSASTSQGSSTGAGNEGSPDGGPGGGSSGGGSGEVGVSLTGRYLVGSLPRPDYVINTPGRIVVRITVDGSGKVRSAEFDPKGSTTNSNTELINAARNAALRARFTASDAEIQTGSITYNFSSK